MTITIIWPKGRSVATLRGKWRLLPDGRIEAQYARTAADDELMWCLFAMEAFSREERARLIGGGRG